MIEHKPWRAKNYKAGINGQRIAIVGYSHHRKAEHLDHNNFTKTVMEKVVGGTQPNNSFFPVIPGYFGYEDPIEFWKQVLFFNFLPMCIGIFEQKYAAGTNDEIRRAKERFLRILGKEKPHKVFVFTTKGWKNCPHTEQEKNGQPCTPLSEEFKDVTWGKYAIGNHMVTAFGLRHPQGANKAHMLAAVRNAMSS